MMPRFFAMLFSLIGLIALSCHPGAGEPSVTEKASKAQGIGYPLPDQFRFDLRGCTYLIEQSGNANRKCNGDQSLEFRVPLTENGEVVWLRVSYLPYAQDLILVYDIQNDQEDYGGNSVARLDGSTLETKWRLKANFNSCPCVRENGYLYVAAWGFLGKIDLDRGRYVWSHDGKESGFAELDYFHALRFDGDDVIFVGRRGQGADRTIRVNRTTGRFVVGK